MKPRRLLVALALGIMALLLLPLPAYAQIPQPSPPAAINTVYVYHHCLETNDQLYVAQYSVSCNTTYNITEAFLTRLMNGAAELKTIAPYTYYNSGYGEGVFSIYFSAAEVASKGMVWNGAYTMKLEGNPTLSWAGGTPPSTSLATFDSWSSSTGISLTRSELEARVLYLADYLEQQWAINMVDTVSTGTYLSAYGVDYFTSVILNLNTMAPMIFTGSSITPDWDRKTYTQTYGNTLATSATGTPLDVSALAASFGISRMWLSAIGWIFMGCGLLFYVLSPMGSTRPLVILSAPLLTGGALLSMIPLIFTVMMGVAAWIFSIWVLLYSPSSA